MDLTETSGTAIAKRLASCNQTARSRAVRLLCRWLPQQPPPAAGDGDGQALTDADLIKIWKGLFYCVWHADKLPFQLDLINRLSSLLETLDQDLALRYFESFLVTMRREWSGIDLLRLDKFYLLIRKFIYRLFALLNKNNWDPDLLGRAVALLSEKSLLSTDKFQAFGVNYHIAEVFFDEMQSFLPIKPETLDSLLRPFILVLEKSGDRVLLNKIKTNVFERLADNGAKYLGGERSEEVEKLGKYALVLAFSEKFFKSASDEGTIQGNRKVLLGMHDRFLKLEKGLEKSGLEILIEGFSNGNGVGRDEALVTEGADEDGGADVRPMKKSKKEKKASDRVDKKSKAKKKKGDDAANGENGLVTNCGGTNCENSKKAKKKKKKKDLSESATQSNGETSDVFIEENGKVDATSNDGLLNFDESVISNLQKQFEKVAAEEGLGSLVTPACTAMMMKKRKRGKAAVKLVAASNGDSITEKSGEKSSKKVRFSMKNNLVWKPQTPLPPQSLRLPPGATPRGSALKKGVPPGPIRETPPTVKKIKVKGSSIKKARKSLRSISPAVKRLRKLQSLSV